MAHTHRGRDRGPGTGSGHLRGTTLEPLHTAHGGGHGDPDAIQTPCGDRVQA